MPAGSGSCLPTCHMSYQLNEVRGTRTHSAGTGLDDPSISFPILTAQAVNSSGAAASRTSWWSTTGHGYLGSLQGATAAVLTAPG